MLDDHVPKIWQGQTTLVFALASAAMGLGNLFRLPYLMGEHGGAPFFLAYVLTLLVAVIPVLSAEVMLGSHGRGSPIGALRWASDQSGRSFLWSWLGWVQVALGLLLAVELLDVTLWLLDRAQVLQSGVLASASAQEVVEQFVTSQREMPRTLWIGIPVLALTALAGLGPQYAMAFVGWLVLPAAFLAMLGLVDFSLERGDLRGAWEYLFARNFQQFDGATVMAGCLSAMYTLGAGVGIGLCFGARTPQQLPLLRSVCAAALIDTVFAVLVAVVVVPLLFATNTAVIEGMALVYVATPYAFANLSQGEVYGSVYFMTLATVSFAALVALVEPAVMVLRRDFMWSRALAAATIGGTLWCSAWARNRWLDFDVLVIYRSLDLAIVLSMLALCLFVAWAMPRPLARGELYREPKWLFVIWWYLLRYWVPVCALVVGVYLAVPNAFSVLGWVSIEP